MKCITPFCTRNKEVGLWCDTHVPVCEHCHRNAIWISQDLLRGTLIPVCSEHAPVCYLCKISILEYRPLVLCTMEEDDRYVYICRDCKSQTRCSHDECMSPAISCFKVGKKTMFTCRVHSGGCLRYACRKIRSNNSHYCYAHTKYANKIAQYAYVHIVSKKLPETIMRLGRAYMVSKIIKNDFRITPFHVHI